MKSLFNRLLSLTLVVMMLIPMISATGLTVSARTESGTCGDNLTWSLDTDTGVLNITGTGDMYDYSAEYKDYDDSYLTTAPWRDYIDSIESLVFGDGVTSIGDYTFYYCDSLTSVTIPDSVTSIGRYAFAICDSLTSVTIPDSVVSIGDDAFGWCYSLRSVTIPDSVTSIGSYAFVECRSLASVTIPDSVTSIGDDAFAFCTFLTSVTIPDSVTSIGSDAFYYCTKLTSLDVDVNNQYYASLDGVLYNKDFTELIQYPIGNSRSTFTIPDSVTIIGEYAFYNCKSLTSVTIGKSVTSIGDYAFKDCTSLTSVTIPDSVTSIGENAFHYYINYINGIYYKLNVTIKCYENSYAHTYAIDNGFKYELLEPECISGTCGDDLTWSLDTDTGVLTIDGTGDMYDYTSEYYNGSNCTTAPWRDYIDSIESLVFGGGVTSIGVAAFAMCHSLTSVTIPDSVTSIGENAFYSCDSLASVTIPDSVSSIGSSAFAWCSSLTSVTIPDSVTSIGDDAFYYCSSLTRVTIPDSVISIGIGAFACCSSLTSVVIGNSVTSIGGAAFGECDSLTSVTIPDSVTSIGSYAFHYYNYGYKPHNITIKCYENSYAHTYAKNNGFKYELQTPKNVSGTCGDNLTWSLDTETGVLTVDGTGDMYDYTSSSSVPWYTYRSSIKTVEIGNSVEGIGRYAFYNCISLTSVTIPDSVKRIGYAAFYNCHSLTSVTIPDSVSGIDYLAFHRDNEYDSSSILNITIKCNENSYAYTYAQKNSFKYELQVPENVSGICGDNLTWTLDTTTGVLIIDGTGDMYQYSHESNVPWYSYRSIITSVVIGDSVTSIGRYAFRKCNVIESVDIGNSVASIDSCAFQACESLTAIIIPDSVTSIGDMVFDYCISLTSVVIPNSVTSISDYTFMDCTSLTSVTIPSSVTRIGDCAFESCTSLTSIIIPDSVTSIGDSAFAYCNALTIKCYENSYAHTYAIDNGFKYELIKCEHIFTNYVSDNNYTCTVDGTKTAYCDNGCGATDTVTDEGSAAHRYTREEVLREPTCSQNGYKLIFCDCGERKNEVISPLEHLYGSYSYNDDATCTADGTETAYCDYGCGASDTRTVDGSMTGHMFVNYKYNNDAACTVDGTESAYCDNGCGASDTRTAEGSMTGHVFVDYEYNNDATCNADGTESAYCDYGCRTTDTRTAVGSMIGHVFIDYEYNSDATCTSDGTESAYCDYGCRTIDTRTAVGTKLAHSYSSVVILEPTCTEDGKMSYTCSYCSDSYVEAIPATGHEYSAEVLEHSTCTSMGLELYICSCGDFYTEDIGLAEHQFTDWVETKAPTYSEYGEESRTCTVCGSIETRELEMLDKPVVTVDNYKVTVTNAEYIKDMRYAPGVYTTTAQIKAAEGNVAIDNSIVEKYTVDGNFVYEMPKGGYYTLWVRMNDGRNYILPLDVTHFTPYVSAYGVKMTVHNLYDVKDFYIAKGEYSTYREIKDNGYIVSITGVKIGNKHDYTYTVYEPGVHTVLIRYNDGSTKLFHETLTVDEPVFTTNGLQVTVSNLPDVKVIRTAYGKWNTVKELKATDTIRNFSAKTAIKGKDPYTIQYREEGIVTVIVEYNNGYQKVFHYEVTKKTPTVEQDGNKVVFSDLDGLVMVRYAKGVYTTSTQIKNAKGSKALKPANIVDGKIEVILDTGTYTFCVQYDDESFNYYVITVE